LARCRDLSFPFEHFPTVWKISRTFQTGKTYKISFSRLFTM